VAKGHFFDCWCEEKSNPSESQPFLSLDLWPIFVLCLAPSHLPLQVLPETIDSNFFHPDGDRHSLPLPGTILDQYESGDPHRPFTFCSVFKMEDRKGYRELVEAFMREFQFTSKVVLLLRTYLHTGAGLQEENFDIWRIRRYSLADSRDLSHDIVRMINDHLESLGLPLSDHFDGIEGPKIEILNHHLTSEQMVMFYQCCDAFVLPTHAEGLSLLASLSLVTVFRMGTPNS
jgi:glycosyltransferase involved in cell wall biosynthesis